MRRPKGIVTRHPIDYDPRKAMAGTFSCAPMVGNFSHGELYNNDQFGAWIYLYGVDISMSAQSESLLEYYKGQKAVPSGQIDYNPIVVGSAILAGQIGTFYSTVCAGQGHLIRLPGPPGGQALFSPYPLCVVPPGYAVCLESGVGNITLDGGFLWMVDKAP